MGNQQLLLLVLGVVIVGVATVAGIVAFNEQGAKSRHNAAVDETLRIVTTVQAWKMKPGILGGGSALTDNDFSGVTFAVLGYATPGADDTYISVYGCYILTGTATGAEIAVFLGHVDGSCSPATKMATVTASGTGPQDIAWETN